MATDTTAQTGTTPNPFPSNTQDFSDSDDEILDNFADGPDDPHSNDDGTPLGLGGAKGNQAEPASATLEADIAGGTTPQAPAPAAKPTEPNTPPSPAAAEPPQEPEVPEFPPALLLMAGLADAAAAKAAGFDNPQALFSAVRWRSQMMVPAAEPTAPAAQGLYRRSEQPAPAPMANAMANAMAKDIAKVTPETPPAPSGDVKPFQLPADKMDMLDEDLQAVLREMHQHYQQEVAALRSSVSQRDEDRVRQQQYDEELQFDQAVQNLGEQWKDVFGEGHGSELARAGQRDPVAMTNFNHRALLFQAVQTVREVNAQQGSKPMSLDQEVQWALMQRYPDKFQQALSGASPSRPGVTASRPTQRRTPPKTQNAQVLADVNAMLKKKHGYALDMGHDEEADGDI